jgi:DnaJ-class molecular chaperone
MIYTSYFDNLKNLPKNIKKSQTAYQDLAQKAGATKDQMQRLETAFNNLDGESADIDGEMKNIAAVFKELGIASDGVAGDLRISITVKEHSLLVRKGFDLYVDVYAPITTLMLGGKVPVPTLKGTQNIDVAPLTQSNTKYTLKGKGIKYLKGFGSGDLIVTLKGEMPKDLDKNTIKLIKELESSIDERAYPKTKKYKEKLDD